MILRPATPDDANGIAALDKALFGIEAWSLPSVVGEISGEGGFAVVVVTDGELLGYAMTMLADEVVDLLRIGVLPSEQRKGIAHTLLSAALDQAAAEGGRRMLLEVSSTNQAALVFYAAEGFVEVDRRRGYYRDGSDGLVLCRSLGRSPGRNPSDGEVST